MITDAFYSHNEAWQNQLLELKQYARSEHSILMLGPSGSGKDVLAKQIHQASSRSNGAFISVNCAAIQESLVESELFGHKKGSFTGANSDRKGAFLSAHNGTLFLDEIGDLSLNVQAKLLRCLENRKIKAVGDDIERPINVRIISATHKPINNMVKDGDFRMDLYFRLNVIQANVPSLAERTEDIAPLAEHFAKEQGIKLSTHAMELLIHQNWEGNIRELKNLILKAACLKHTGEITSEQISRILLRQSINLPEISTQKLTRGFIRQIERGLLIERLIANNWNQRKTARELGIPKSTLHDQLRRFKIQKTSDA